MVQPPPIDPAHADPGALHVVECALELAVTRSVALLDDGDGLADQGGEHVGAMIEVARTGLWSAEWACRTSYRTLTPAVGSAANVPAIATLMPSL